MTNRAGATPTNAGAALGSLLADLGIKNTATRTELGDLLTDELHRRGLEATVAGIRYNVATLLADPHNAALLSYDVEDLRVCVNARSSSPLESIVVKTRRTRSQENAR